MFSHDFAQLLAVHDDTLVTQGGPETGG